MEDQDRTAVRSTKAPTDGFAGARTATTTAGLDAILLEVSEVSVARPREEIRFSVIVRSLILVLNEQCNRGTKSHAVLQAGLELNKILLVSLKKGMLDEYAQERKRDLPG